MFYGCSYMHHLSGDDLGTAERVERERREIARERKNNSKKDKQSDRDQKSAGHRCHQCHRHNRAKAGRDVVTPGLQKKQGERKRDRKREELER